MCRNLTFTRFLGRLQPTLFCSADRDVSNEVLRLVERPDLCKIKPDVLVGLSRRHIRIAQSASSPTCQLRHWCFCWSGRSSLTTYVTVRGCPFFNYTLSLTLSIVVLTSDHYLSFFFGELKGPSGSAGEGKIQNVNVCYLSLLIYVRIDGRGRGGEATMERVPNRRWTGRGLFCRLKDAEV